MNFPARENVRQVSNKIISLTKSHNPVTLENHDRFLNIDGGDGCTTQNTLKITLKGNSMVCKLYPSKQKYKILRNQEFLKILG